ncbi:unnamed protein product [Urochloa decumbens]|uniref:F-box domain-containing protein n=1 Tax=Urochloa decumbens TaxID=240449 RepID=A0ABC8XH07_9POAL
MSKRPMSQTRSPAADLPPDDLFLDIFLRLPPEPENLLVASLVCKRWSRIIRDPAFLARFRAFHRATPVLGFYQNIGGRSSIRFVPIADPAPRLSAPECFQNGTCRVLDCRHGRVLICDDSLMALFVWDPMAVTAYDVGSLPELSGEENFTAVLVCSPGNDDHTDCHSAPFRVVYVDNSEDDDQLLVSVRVFFSETDSWAEDGGIGFAGVNLSSLHFWSRKTDSEGVAGWALIRIIDMEMLPISDTLTGDMLLWSSVVGFADDSDVFFLGSEAGVFTINLRSKQLKEVPEAISDSDIYPYTSFYSRGNDIIKDDRDVKYVTRVPKEDDAGSCSGGGRG